MYGGTYKSGAQRAMESKLVGYRFGEHTAELTTCGKCRKDLTKAEKIFICDQCRSVIYCSKACRELDWNRDTADSAYGDESHKDACGPYVSPHSLPLHDRRTAPYVQRYGRYPVARAPTCKAPVSAVSAKQSPGKQTSILSFFNKKVEKVADDCDDDLPPSSCGGGGGGSSDSSAPADVDEGGASAPPPSESVPEVEVVSLGIPNPPLGPLQAYVGDRYICGGFDEASSSGTAVLNGVRRACQLFNCLNLFWRRRYSSMIIYVYKNTTYILYSCII